MGGPLQMLQKVGSNNCHKSTVMFECNDIVVDASQPLDYKHE